MATTIKDVAKVAGVSTSTVSHALNGTRYVSPKLKEKIFTVVEELGYELNSVASSLARGQTRMIGLLVPDLSTSYAGEIIRGIDDELAKHDYTIMLYTTRRHHSRISAFITALTRGMSDGLLVLVPGDSEPYLTALTAQDFPYVMIDFEGDGSIGASVSVTNWHGAYKATSHLIELGHRRIGFVKGEIFLGCSIERFEAYKNALHDNGITFDESLVQQGDFSQLSGYDAAASLMALDEPPTAIFASNDEMAFGVADQVRRQGLRIPEDISLVGFDDIPQADLMRPALTTVRQPLHEIGRVAAEMLIDRIQSPERPIKRIQLETTLIERDTCAPIPQSK